MGSAGFRGALRNVPYISMIRDSKFKIVKIVPIHPLLLSFHTLSFTTLQGNDSFSVPMKKGGYEEGDQTQVRVLGSSSIKVSFFSMKATGAAAAAVVVTRPIGFTGRCLWTTALIWSYC
jgi:hypothetical protein